MPKMIIIIGPQSAGKGLLRRTYCKIVAPYATEIASEQLFSDFSAHAEKR